MTKEQESLIQRINLLNEEIQELRRSCKDYSFEVEELIRLILELDSMGNDT